MKLVIATKNQGKLREIRNILEDLEGLELIPLSSFSGFGEIDESGTTFAENAFLKAKAVCDFSMMPAVADDSGLVIDALGGRPGIYSARYGGENLSDLEKNRLILEEMKNIPPGRRSARFVCAVSLLFPWGGHYTAEGLCEGEISEDISGNEGFGYDPVFFVTRAGRKMSFILPAQKNLISHRAIAFRKIKTTIHSLLENEKLNEQ